MEDKASNRSANGDCIHCPTLKQNATKILNKWQYIADKLDEDLILRAFLRRLVDATAKGKRTMQALFSGLFLGGVDRLLPLMDQSFHVLGLVLCFAGFQKRESRDVLLERTTILEGFLKVNLIT